MKENEIHQAFIAWLNKAGVLFRHDRTDKRTTTKIGEPDFAMYEDGRVLFVEFKALGGKLRPEQIKRKKQLEDAGCKVVIAVGEQGLEVAILETTVWRGMPLQGHPSKPLDCQGISGGGKGKADVL